MTRSPRTILVPPALALAACAGAIVPAACSDRAGSDVAVAGAGATWRWRAERMEISALTTPLRSAEPGRQALDVRIEFFDSERDETKALGQLVVVVRFDSNEIGRVAADLAGVGGHSRAWDSVTETYSLRVPLSIEPPPGRVLVVQASFDGIDGARMSASREVRWPETAK
jgi:hypothetical protein